MGEHFYNFHTHPDNRARARTDEGAQFEECEIMSCILEACRRRTLRHKERIESWNGQWVIHGILITLSTGEESGTKLALFINL